MGLDCSAAHCAREKDFGGVGGLLWVEEREQGVFVGFWSVWLGASMEFRPIRRSAAAFQQSITAGQLEVLCKCAFGDCVGVVSAIELANGMYNNTYQVDIGEKAPVILRVAPEPGRQFRVERELMRNEHASLPFFAPIASLMPRTLTVDFTHDLIGRDYLFQTMLPGIPAPDGLPAYPRPLWGSFFREMGQIARKVHGVGGSFFGVVAGPVFSRWSEAVVVSLEDIAADLCDGGLDATDVQQVVKAADQDRDVLDQITEPKLLHGDLWTVNVMLGTGSAEPVITGVFDCDRASWGDPAADWTIYMAARKRDTEREAFWEAYGQLDATPEALRRALYYEARHVGAIRLERYRRGNLDVTATYDEMGDVLAGLRK